MRDRIIKKGSPLKVVALLVALALVVPMLTLFVSANNTDLPEIPIGSGGSDNGTTDNPVDGGTPGTNVDTPPTDEGGSSDTGLIIVIIVIALVVLGLLGCIGYLFFSRRKK